MTDLPRCPVCGCRPATKIQNRGMNCGSAEIRCGNGCAGVRVGRTFAPGGGEEARAELEEKWKQLVKKEQGDL